jgi:hypothetical protein
MMKVYSVVCSVDYEGCDFLGVFVDRKSAEDFTRSQEGFGKYQSYSYGVVESELGQPVDFYSMVDWVE